MKSSKREITVLKQICKLIPGHLVEKLAKCYGVNKQSRTYSPWSHVVSLFYTQLSHALSLNDVCDALNNHGASLSDIRGATALKRNTFSHANRTRNANMAEELFWSILKHLQTISPEFGLGRKYKGVPRRFKKVVNAIDSSTIKLFANCMDWAKHRRRKEAAKMQLCSNLQAGKIVTFDKAYIKFRFLYNLTRRMIFWVGRAKDNMQYETVEQHLDHFR